MKTIGLIGGVTWHSTVEYYKKINEKVATQLGKHHSAKIVISSVDFEEIFLAQNAQNSERVITVLKTHLKSLESAGVDFFAVGSNTLHIYSEELTAITKLPMVHIVDETAKEAKLRGLKKLCLLGTGFTMRHSFFVQRMDRHGLKIVVPTDQEKDEIHRSIFEELTYGKFKPETKKMYLNVVKNVQNQGCDGVILGCTEIPMILCPEDASIPLLDTTEIHAKALVKNALF